MSSAFTTPTTQDDLVDPSKPNDRSKCDRERTIWRRCETAPVSSVGHIHHVELWVSDLARAERSWGWLLTALGYEPFQAWDQGRSWRLSSTYIVVEQSSDVVGLRHERRAPGVNHLAFHAGDRADVDRLANESVDHGWTVMFEDHHPYAGGPDHYAAYLENDDGFEVELCASKQ
jgi:catechol 2,3-dioxygenase-like lactoylglutathione lyase family enzyme